MIIHTGELAHIEQLKIQLGLSGDVYLIDDHLMESLESHKRLYPQSQATTIEEAEQERLFFLQQECEENLKNASIIEE